MLNGPTRGRKTVFHLYLLNPLVIVAENVEQPKQVFCYRVWGENKGSGLEETRENKDLPLGFLLSWLE